MNFCKTPQSAKLEETEIVLETAPRTTLLT
jgi:hypothetical protein